MSFPAGAGLLAACCLAASFCLASPWQESEEIEVTPEMLELGEDVYGEQCRSCHGQEGKGDGPASRFLDPKPRDLTSGEWKHAEGGTVRAIGEVVRYGVEGTGMEPMGELLTDEEIEAVAAYVLEEIAPARADDDVSAGAGGEPS